MIKDTPCEYKEGEESARATAYQHCMVTGMYLDSLFAVY